MTSGFLLRVCPECPELGLPGLPVDWTQSLVAKGQGEASDLSWEIHTQTLPVANPKVSLGWKGDADKLDSLREHTMASCYRCELPAVPAEGQVPRSWMKGYGRHRKGKGAAQRSLRSSIRD